MQRIRDCAEGGGVLNFLLDRYTDNVTICIVHSGGAPALGTM